MGKHRYLFSPVIASLALTALSLGATTFLVGCGKQTSVASSDNKPPVQTKVASGSGSSFTPAKGSALSVQMALGNPDQATKQSTNREHYLIQRAQYALSYNDQLHFPNWVAWHLEHKDIGDVERGQFIPDSSLPSGFTVVTPSDYTRSGYDRGHNCPSKDRTATRADNDAVFLMTNMTPQAHGLNAGPWEQLESYCRDLTDSGNQLYIYCGHGFSSPKHSVIGKAGIAVPDFAWKVVVVVPTGGRITASTRVIAVRMPNINTISRNDWHEYLTSVEDVEKATGLRFFDAVPQDIASQLKNRVDFDPSAPSHSGKPASTSKGNTAPASTGSNSGAATQGQVWVNTRSGAYWRPGTQYYGKTKQGKYMSEADAIKAGYHAAGGQ